MTDPGALGSGVKIPNMDPNESKVDVVYRQLQRDRRLKHRSLQRQFILDALGQRDLVREAVEACFYALKRNAKPLLQITAGMGDRAEAIVREAKEKEAAKNKCMVEVIAPERDKRLGKQLNVVGETGTGIAWELQDGSYIMKDEEDTLWRWCEGCGPPPRCPTPPLTAAPPKSAGYADGAVSLPKVPGRRRSMPASAVAALPPAPPPSKGNTSRKGSKESTGRDAFDSQDSNQKLPPVGKSGAVPTPEAKGKVVKRGKPVNLVPRSTM